MTTQIEIELNAAAASHPHPNTKPIIKLFRMYEVWSNTDNESDCEGSDVDEGLQHIRDLKNWNFYDWWSRDILCYITKLNWKKGNTKKFHILNINAFYSHENLGWEESDTEYSETTW